MAAPIITLVAELKTQLEFYVGGTFERRNAPYFKREQVTAGKWIIVPAADEQAIRSRAGDRSTLTIDVAYQQALPDKTDANPDPTENHSWFDARMATVEAVKNLFRGGGQGPLRNRVWTSSFYFQTMENAPIYRPDMIQDYQIFTSVIRLTFAGELAASAVSLPD